MENIYLNNPEPDNIYDGPSDEDLKRIEGKRKDILRQLEWLQLTREIEKSRILGQEAKDAGREDQAGKHFEQAEQLETSREALGGHWAGETLLEKISADPFSISHRLVHFKP